MPTFEWLSRPQLRDPVAFLAFSGWGDAGEASTKALRHLTTQHDTERIGEFESDQFFDFQVSRPVVSLDEAGVRSITWPTTEVSALTHHKRDIVVVIGEEPNYNWKKFVTELADVLVELGVGTAVLLGAFVGQVPHTVPVPVMGASTSPKMISAHGLLPSRYEGPTGIVGVLTHALTSRGLDTISLWAAVPHYLSNQTYAPGVEALLRKAAELSDVPLDLGPLESRSASFLSSVDAAIDESEELAEYVRQLEADGMSEDTPGGDLVEEIERFLRDS